MESNSSEAATSNAASSTSVTGGLDMYPHQQSQASHQDFKMPSSLGEVQRIIGLSLSKIQMGRNQRGGLPLHKNLLVATVLNKARDLYMQETMYMNYKMMTGQFAAAASAASASNTNSQMEYSQHYHHHYGMGMSSNQNETDMDELEPVEANEADYDEDSESDVEDECDVTSVPVASSNNVNPSTTYPILCNMHSPEPATPSPADHQPHHLPNPGAASMPAHEAVNNPTTPATSDEGFIDEPDCDCDARNFSTSESRVPFQYCYHCAPFHPSSGRGPTLVPSPSPTPASAAATATSSHTKASASPSKNESCDGSDPTNAAVIYDMDSQTTKDSTEAGPSSVVRGTKRRRSSSEEEPSDEQETCKKRSRESTDLDSSHQLNCSQDESGYQSADSSHTEVFHPAFRGSASSGTAESNAEGVTNGGNTMEIDQITSLVSIFSFGQHIMAAAAAKAACSQKREFEEEDEEEEEEEKVSRSQTKTKTNKKSESSEDSDSESDTSSDSGHSSDDHEAVAGCKEEDSQSNTTGTTTKLTRSVSTPDLCAVTASNVASNTTASEAPPCLVEVASL